ncbi:MAG: hypothetical protein AAF678_09620 [Pseudomonadota bacterium]
MSAERAPLFVGRRAYYRRRLADTARLMPILGIGLFMFPLFWISPETTASGTSATGAPAVRTVSVMFYLFIVWIGLAMAAGLISRGLDAETEAKQSSSAGGAGAGD